MTKLRLAINGLGRIGKCIIRAYFENFTRYHNDIEIVAINTGSQNIENRVHSIRYDSVHGKFKEKIQILDNNSFAVANNKITMLFERNITLINWQDLGVDLVLECTGAFNKNKAAHQHLDAGAKKVIVSAPYNDADVTIVAGVNDNLFNPFTHHVISIGSCTTNCLAPVAKVLNDSIGIESGFITTVHAYTNDQSLLDGTHNDRRRARAAALSIIPSSTGATKSIGLVLPELQGKLGGAAIRIPTANVAMIDLKFLATKSTTKDQINQLMETAAIKMPNVLGIANEELVSCDFNHTQYSAIFDTTLTQVINQNFCRVVAWYDNEWAFSNRMLDVAQILSYKI